MFCVGLSTSQVEEALEAAKTMSGFDAGDAQRVLRIAGPLFLHDDTTVTTCDTMVTCLRSRAVQTCPGRLKAAVRDLRTASRMKQLEQENTVTAVTAVTG